MSATSDPAMNALAKINESAEKASWVDTNFEQSQSWQQVQGEKAALLNALGKYKTVAKAVREMGAADYLDALYCLENDDDFAVRLSGSSRSVQIRGRDLYRLALRGGLENVAALVKKVLPTCKPSEQRELFLALDHIHSPVLAKYYFELLVKAAKNIHYQIMYFLRRWLTTEGREALTFLIKTMTTRQAPEKHALALDLLKEISNSGQQQALLVAIEGVRNAQARKVIITELGIEDPSSTFATVTNRSPSSESEHNTQGATQIGVTPEGNKKIAEEYSDYDWPDWLRMRKPSKSQAPYLSPTTFPVVHMKDGSLVPREILGSYVANLSRFDPQGTNHALLRDLRSIAKLFDPEDFSRLVCSILRGYRTSGAPGTHMWLLLLGVIDPSADVFMELLSHFSGTSSYQYPQKLFELYANGPHSINRWVLYFASLRYNKTPVRADAWVRGIYKSNTVSWAEALISSCPTLGLDEQASKWLSVGSERYRASLGPAFDLRLEDEQRRPLNELPLAKIGENPGLSLSAKQWWDSASICLPSMIEAMSHLLQTCFEAQTKWSLKDNNNIFLGHPILSRIARTVVWAVVDNNAAIKCTFRPSDDGTLVTSMDEPISKLPDGEIILPHPLMIPEEQREQWWQQLQDYKIVPFTDQLRRKIFLRTSESLSLFKGALVANWGQPLEENRWVRHSYKPMQSRLLPRSKRQLCISTERSNKGNSIALGAFSWYDSDSDGNELTALDENELKNWDAIEWSEALRSLAKAVETV